MVAVDFYWHCHRPFGMLLAACSEAGFNGERIGRTGAGPEREKRSLLNEVAADSVGAAGANSMES
jgi:hypothetical protein